MSDDVHAKVERVIAGDRHAAAWLYDTYAPDLFRRLRRRYAYQGGPDAEDLLQDAYAFFFQNECKVLRDFLERVPRDEGAGRALERHLWNLACGLATNLRRSAWTRRMRTVAEVEVESVPGGAEGRTIARDLLERIDACLRQERERVYLYYQLRYRDHLTPAEIARATGWSRKATYKLKEALNEALARCAEELEVDVMD